MKDEDFQIEFPWSLAFIITGLCCFGFIGFMKLLNSNSPAIFLWVGLGALSLGLLLTIVSLFSKKDRNTSVYCSDKDRGRIH
jgi:hypothetical protein